MMLLLFTVLSVADPLKPRQIEERIVQMIGSEPYRDGLWGVSVFAPLRNEYLIKIHDQKNFRTASNLKILTTLMAFDFLGPDYLFETEFGYRGEIRDGILEGDLIIQGRGDPSISGKEDAYRTEDLLRPVLDRLKSLGIREIRGDLIATTDWFSDPPIQPTWEWDDVGRWYGTPATPLGLDNGWMTLHYVVDEHGKPTHYPDTSPNPDFRLIDQLTFLSKKSIFQVERTWGTDQLTLTGNLPPCSQIDYVFATWRPDMHFLHVFRKMIEDTGIRVHGQTHLAGHVSETRPIYLLESDDLAFLARTLMRESQNRYADLFLKTTARHVSGEGSFEQGAALAKDWLEEIGAGGTFSMRDGSGLSAQNYLSPHQITHLLNYALERDYRDAWLKTFPVMGRTGTLEKRGVTDGFARGRTWAKTGYIFRARNLSGYLETVAGEPLIFSILVNNYGTPTSEIERGQDRICEWLVRLKPARGLKKRKPFGLFSNILDPIPGKP